jgi:hypothetical protein
MTVIRKPAILEKLATTYAFLLNNRVRIEHTWEVLPPKPILLKLISRTIC